MIEIQGPACAYATTTVSVGGTTDNAVIVWRKAGARPCGCQTHPL